MIRGSVFPMDPKTKKSQATLDLLISYSVAILIISIALYVVLELGVFNSRLAPTYCTGAPSFVCSEFAIAPNSTLTIVFADSIAANINITAIACSNQANTIGAGPRYGNVYVANDFKAPQYYPDSSLLNGLIVYPSNQSRFSVYCYNGGGRAKGALGNTFSGIVWINYTIANLPGYSNVEQAMTFTAKYT